jgi:hypothetical protein
MALVLKETGRPQEALEYSRKAQMIWENADPEYSPASDNKALLLALEESL